MLISYFRIISNLQQGTTFCISLVFKLQRLDIRKLYLIKKCLMFGAPYSTRDTEVQLQFSCRDD